MNNAEQHLVENLKRKCVSILTSELDEEGVDDYSVGYLAAMNSFKMYLEDALEVYEYMKENEK